MELTPEEISSHYVNPHRLFPRNPVGPPEPPPRDPSRLQQGNPTRCSFLTSAKSQNSLISAPNNIATACQKICCPDSHEEGIRLGIEFLTDHSRSHAAELSRVLPYQSLLNVYWVSQDRATRSNISLILMNVSSVCPSPSLCDHLCDIVKAVKRPLDSESPKNLQIVLCNILSVEKNMRTDVEEALSCICESLFSSEKDIQDRMIDTLSKLGQNPEFAEFLIGKNLDFKRLIDGNTKPETHTRIMKLMLTLLPSSRVLDPLGVPKCDKCPSSKDFAVKVQDSLVTSFVERPLAINWTLLAFAATLVARPIQMSNEIVMSLVSFSTCLNVAPCVLAVLTFFVGRNQDHFCWRIVEELEKIRPPPAIEKWYQAGIMSVKRKMTPPQKMDYSEWSIQMFNDAAADQKLDWFTFLTGGGIDRCRTLLDQQTEGNFEELVRFCSELLSFCPLPKNFGPSSSPDALYVLLAERTVNIRLPSEQMVQVRAPLYTPVSLIEGLLNTHQFEYDRGRVAAALAQQNLESLIIIPEKPTASQLSALGRGLFEDYPALEFRTDTQRYAIGDTMLSLVCDSFEQSDVPTLIAYRKVISEHVQSFPKFRPFRSQFFDRVLEFLTISAQLFSLHSQNMTFISRVKSAMQFPLNSIGRLSPAFALPYQYPELFPYDLRLLAFQLCALDPLSGLSRLVAEFSPSDQTLLPGQIGIPLTIQRDRVAIDGSEFLKRFASNKLPLNLRFAGEQGSGPGVLREFFTLLSRTFKNNQQLWRYNQTLGLFPSPIADSAIFQEIGVLVAKALSMDCLLELPLSSAFIAMIRGEEIEMNDVDPELVRVLSGDIDGVDFTCPGYPEAFEREGEVVGVENRKEFLDLVQQSVVGDRVAACAQAFRTGFERVLSVELLDLFSKEEIVGLIGGRSEILRIEDFELNGYETDEAPIVALSEVINEFNDQELKAFVLFFTGAQLLPVGGAKALHPKPGIWKMEKEGISSDDLLPTSSVCINVLKLPAYTSKDKLRSKLLLAMSDGKDSFFLD